MDTSLKWATLKDGHHPKRDTSLRQRDEFRLHQSFTSLPVSENSKPSGAFRDSPAGIHF